MMENDIKSLEGWLLKKKANKKLFSSSDVKRWFKVEKVKGEDTSELALCYYQSKQSKDSKGWIFLSDITEISEDVASFTIVSPHRTMCLEAQTRAEHRLWVNGLTKLCPNSLINGQAQYKENYSPDVIGAKSYDQKPSRSGSRQNSFDSAAAIIDANERNGLGKSGRLHQDEDIAESTRSRSNDRDRDRERGREKEKDKDRDRNNGRDNRDSRERGEDSDRGRDSSTERSTRYKDDHRLRNDRSDLPSTEATASARMHGHISRGDPNDDRYNDRSRSDRPSSRPSSKENEQNSSAPLPSKPRRNETRTSREYLSDNNDDLDTLDINKPAQPSREARLQERYERMRSGSQETNHQGISNSLENKDEEEEKGNIEESKYGGEMHEQQKPPIQEKKVKAPTGPRPTQPRKAADIRDDEDDDDSDGNLSDSNRKEYSRPLASTEIDELRSGSLMVNLDDSDDDGGEVDFKAEKRRYTNNTSDDKSSNNDGTGSRPPRPPIKSQAKGEGSNNNNNNNNSSNNNNSRNSNTNKGPSKDSNFVNEDWDEDDEPAPTRRGKPKVTEKQQIPIHTGPKADNGWLEDDFDD